MVDYIDSHVTREFVAGLKLLRYDTNKITAASIYDYGE